MQDAVPSGQGGYDGYTRNDNSWSTEWKLTYFPKEKFVTLPNDNTSGTSCR